MDNFLFRKGIPKMSDSTLSTEPEDQRRGVTAFFKDVYLIWITERPTQFAAAVAYFAIFSIVPIMYLSFFVTERITATLFIEEWFFIQLSDILGTEIALTLQTAISDMAIRTTSVSIVASLIGFVVLLFTASTIFFQLQHTLNTIWKIPPNESRATRDFVHGRLMAFVMLLGVILVLILSATISLIISFVQRVIDLPILLHVLNFAAFAGLLILSCALIFKVLPNAKVAWRDVWVGAATFGLPVTMGLALIGTIITSNRFTSPFEAAGMTAIFLMGFYFLGQFFVLGAVVTRVYADKYGAGISPLSSQKALT